MGSSTEHSAYGPSHNPWDLDRIPGVGRRQRVAAVAAGAALLALGTDRWLHPSPGAVTGTVGVADVRRVSATARGAGQLAGPGGSGARTVLDAALLHELIGGHDPPDSTSSIKNRSGTGRRGPAGCRRRPPRRQGLPRSSGFRYQAGVRSVRESVELMTKAGAEVVEVSCPSSTPRPGDVLPDPPRRGVVQRPARRDALRAAGHSGGRPSAEVSCAQRVRPFATR
jgi:aspartyl-tRNA(Asn)/glutamyl-tRNA(Gln) amidotransferase subunit A